MVSAYCKKCGGYAGSHRCSCEGGPQIYCWSDGVWRAAAQAMPLSCLLVMIVLLTCMCVIVSWF